MKRLRSEVAPAAARAAGLAVAEHVAALPGFERVPRIALYASLPDELPSGPLLEACRGKACLFPRCRPDGTLEFAPANAFEELVSGRYGVREPVAAAVPLAREDWVIVPGVAFDAEGGRLGRGAGFYDRTFAAEGPSPRRIGVGFAFQGVAHVPMEPHDRRLDACVTERGSRLFASWNERDRT